VVVPVGGRGVVSVRRVWEQPDGAIAGRKRGP